MNEPPTQQFHHEKDKLAELVSGKRRPVTFHMNWWVCRWQACVLTYVCGRSIIFHVTTTYPQHQHTTFFCSKRTQYKKEKLDNFKNATLWYADEGACSQVKAGGVYVCVCPCLSVVSVAGWMHACEL